MHTLRVTTVIAASAERCFDLARSVEAHLHSADGTAKRAVADRTSGLMELGEQVTWEGRHFRVTQRLTGRITAFDRSHHFHDRIEKGVFLYLEHDQFFEAADSGGTPMIDVMRFAAPIGPLGWLAERLVLGPYLARFLKRRAAILKQLAESDAWSRFIPPA